MQTNLISLLLVEDNKSDASIIKEILSDSKKYQYNLIFADRISQAYTRLKENNIDIILLDLNLPDSQGIETISKLELHSHKIPIIVLTGLNDEDIGLKAIEIGAQDYLVKDQIDFSLLDRFIQYSIERQQLKLDLETTKEQFKTLIDTNKDGIIVVDENDIIQYVNAAAEAFLESSSEELLENPFGFAFSIDKMTEIEFITKTKNTKIAELKAVKVLWMDKKAYSITLRDTTEKNEYIKKREFYALLLEKLNKETTFQIIMKEIITLIKEYTRFNSIGIRLKEGDDFPYYITEGFSNEFVEAEKYLCNRDSKGEIILDSKGNAYLECMCGNVLCKRTDPLLPFFTKKGSFWTNSTTELLASASKEDLQVRTRNRCNAEAYETVALIPLYSGNDIIGLLQLNDFSKDRLTPDKINFFEEFAGSIAIAIMRTRLQMELVEHKDNLEKTVAEQTRHLEELINTLNSKKEELIAQNEKLQVKEEELVAQNEMLQAKEEELVVQNEELIDLNVKLKEAHKHKDYFLSTMSHELRTPLNAILGFSQALNLQYFGPLNETQIKHVSLINSSGEHLLDLINDILDIAKIDAGTVKLNIESFTISEIIENVISINTSQFSNKNISCEYIIDPDIKTINADKRKFKQILINLLSNAHKYSPNDTTIRIEVVKIVDNAIKTSIIDEGVGIQKGDLKNIFSDFYQSDYTRDQALGGSGIGLALTKRLVLLHKGDIGVESETNKGSTFWFTLPDVEPLEQAEKRFLNESIE